MPPERPVPGFEIGPLEELRGRVPGVVLERFNQVFVPYDCAPGTPLWARPGQVQRFGPRSELKGTHLRFAPPFPGAESLLAPWRRPRRGRPLPGLRRDDELQ